MKAQGAGLKPPALLSDHAIRRETYALLNRLVAAESHQAEMSEDARCAHYLRLTQLRIEARRRARLN